MPKSKLIDFVEKNDPDTISVDLSYRTIDTEEKARLIKALKSNTFVTELNLSKTNFTNEEIIDLIKACPRLKSLIILHLNLNDSVAIALSQHCRELEYLDALDNRFTGIGVTALSKLPKLNSLNLGSNLNISYDDMSTISIFPSLQVFYLWHVKIGDEGALRLARSETLKELHLGNNDIRYRGAGALYDSKIRDINLDNNNIGSSWKLKFSRRAINFADNAPQQGTKRPKS